MCQVLFYTLGIQLQTKQMKVSLFKFEHQLVTYQ